MRTHGQQLQIPRWSDEYLSDISIPSFSARTFSFCVYYIFLNEAILSVKGSITVTSFLLSVSQLCTLLLKQQICDYPLTKIFFPLIWISAAFSETLPGSVPVTILLNQAIIIACVSYCNSHFNRLLKPYSLDFKGSRKLQSDHIIC